MQSLLLPNHEQLCSHPHSRRKKQIFFHASISSGQQQQQQQPQHRSPVLILPGFLSNNTLAAGSQYAEMARNLEALGHRVEILPASTWDWVPTLSGGSFKWYLQRMAADVKRMADECGGQLSLVGVSAGGWLARLALSSLPYDGEVFGLGPAVHTLVTCGTPHSSLEQYPFGRAEEAWIMDLHGLPPNITTSLQYCNHHLPDANSLKPVRVVCVAGNAVRGEQLSVGELAQRVVAGKLKLQDANTWAFIQSSYVANCGVAEVEGDAVTPVDTAVLPGADVLVLPDVWHNATPGKKWYGSKEVVEEWDKYLP